MEIFGQKVSDANWWRTNLSDYIFWAAKERWREKEMNEIQLERSADRKKKNRKGQITSNKDKQKK